MTPESKPRRPRKVGEAHAKTVARIDRRALIDPLFEKTEDARVHAEATRPTTRGECQQGPRPCPWVGCKYHLYLDVNLAGGLVLNFPDREPWQLLDSCALDIADRGGVTLEEVGALMNLTRERIRQVEASALGNVGPDYEEYR